MFKPGDIVRCVRPSLYLREGLYEIVSIARHDSRDWVNLKQSLHNYNGWSIDRFELVPNPTPLERMFVEK